MLVRVRGPKGACRITIEPKDHTVKLFEEVAAKMKMTGSFKLCMKPNGSDEVQLESATIGDTPIKHGDMIYLVVEPSTFLNEEATTSQAVAEVDRLLDAKDGLVYQKKGTDLCKCVSEKSKCIYCMPLNPFDEKVLNRRDPPIKKLSFHSYLRKLKTAGDSGRSSNIINLQEPRCTVKKNCSGCPGWPTGICTQCQPSAMLLKAQEYRHVDYVSFDTSEIVGNMIGAWVNSGVQRMGFLYGKYAEYDQVPLGIQAIVSAIYEPPQSSEQDGVELLDDPNADKVDKMYRLMGLEKVGWVFTDLEADSTLKPPNNTKYKRFESDDNSMLTGYEVIYAALQQTEHPNIIHNKYSSAGKFGSKFVTCVISGGEDNEIGFKAYQATNNAMALVRAEAIVPSAHMRNEVCVKVSDKEHYVPDVLYVRKNEYGREVTLKAEPGIPLEYLFVTLEAGYSTDSSKSLFTRSDFTIENRGQIGQLQDLPSIQRRFAEQGTLLSKLSDFHLLLYLATNEIVPFIDEMPTILKAVKDRDAVALEDWAARSEKWQTLGMLMQFSS